MDALLEIFFEFFAEIFGQLFLLLLSKSFEKVEISSNRTKKLIKFIITFIFLLIAIMIIIMSINKNLGNILFLLSSVFILFLIIEHLLSFINNNIFRNKIFKIFIFVTKEIVSYGYFITLLCLLEWIDHSEKKFVIIFSILGLVLLVLRDCYRSHRKERGISSNYSEEEFIEKNINDGYLIYNTNPKDKYFKLLYNCVYFLIASVLYFSIVLLVKKCDIIDSSIWTLVLLFLITFGVLIFIIILSILFFDIGESKISKIDNYYKITYEKELSKATFYFYKNDIENITIRKYPFVNRYKSTIKLYRLSKIPMEEFSNIDNINKKRKYKIVISAFCSEEDINKIKVLK